MRATSRSVLNSRLIERSLPVSASCRSRTTIALSSVKRWTTSAIIPARTAASHRQRRPAALSISVELRVLWRGAGDLVSRAGCSASGAGGRGGRVPSAAERQDPGNDRARAALRAGKHPAPSPRVGVRPVCRALGARGALPDRACRAATCVRSAPGAYRRTGMIDVVRACGRPAAASGRSGRSRGCRRRSAGTTGRTRGRTGRRFP